LQATFWHCILELGQKHPATHWVRRLNIRF
jgi:hypothetical protein